MGDERWKDRLTHILLQEVIGNDSPPDFSHAILKSVQEAKRKKLWQRCSIAAGVLIACSLSWWLMSGSPQQELQQSPEIAEKEIEESPPIEEVVSQPEPKEVEEPPPFMPKDIPEVKVASSANTNLEKESEQPVLAQIDPVWNINGVEEKEPWGRRVQATSESPQSLKIGKDLEVQLRPGAVVQFPEEKDFTQIKLNQGEIFCRVTPGKGPFQIQSELGSVRVVGTQFQVKLLEEREDIPMIGKGLWVKVLIGVVAVLGPWGEQELKAGEENIFGKRKGKLVGILVEKARDGKWVQVYSEELGESVKFIPQWKGGAPHKGGGPDKKTIRKIQEIPGANLVQVSWMFEEHLRVMDIKIIKPRGKKGTIEGEVVARGKNHFELKPKKGHRERFLPHWRGGMPKDGGGLDEEMVEAIRELRVGDRIRVQWEYEERRRVVGIKILERAEREEEHEEKKEEGKEHGKEKKEEREEHAEHEEEGNASSLKGFAGMIKGKVISYNRDEQTVRIRVTGAGEIWKHSKINKKELIRRMREHKKVEIELFIDEELYRGERAKKLYRKLSSKMVRLRKNQNITADVKYEGGRLQVLEEIR